MITKEHYPPPFPSICLLLWLLDFDSSLLRSGNLFFTEFGFVRKVAYSGGTYVVSTVAGDGSSDFADGTGVAAKFDNPVHVRLDGRGNLFVAGGCM